jgi:hypothetical protein
MRIVESENLPPGYARLVTSFRSRASEARNVRSLIKALGGPLFVGELVGRDHSTICQWSRNNVIPGKQVALLAQLFGLPEQAIRKFATPTH